VGLGTASNDDATEEDMANQAFIVDSHQAELRNERGRLAQSLNETRFVWPTECQLIDLEDFKRDFEALVDEAAFLQDIQEIRFKCSHLSVTLIILILR